MKGKADLFRTLLVFAACLALAARLTRQRTHPGRLLGSRGENHARCFAWMGLGWLVLLPLFCASPLNSQTPLRPADLDVIRGTPQEKNHQEMLFRFLLHSAEQESAEAHKQLQAIHSEAELRDWQKTHRAAFLNLIGGLPSKKAPLDAHVVGEIRRDEYSMHKVIFESLPNFYVTANLYMPAEGKGPFPAILSPVGHTRNGKADARYQHLFIGLAKRGYVVLTYDPPGQGERMQYWDFLTNQRGYTFRTNEHGLDGVSEYLLGQDLARYFIWDGIRALDYLLTLPEVDHSRIGITGNSGGGVLTTYIAMLDSRIKVAVPVTFISSIPKKIENRVNDAESDPEQDIPGLLQAGLDHAELLAMIAPRPVLIGAATKDFFPIEGTRQTYRQIHQLYVRLGVPEQVKMVEFKHEHKYSQPLRETAYRWFDRWLKGVQDEAGEPEITAENDKTLQCTVTGQVVTSLGGERVQNFNRREAERLVTNLESQRRDPAFRRNLQSRIRVHLAFPSARLEPHVETMGGTEVKSLRIEKFLLETEPGIVVPARVIRPKAATGRLPAVVYLRDRTGNADSPALYEGLARAGKVVVVADVRGFSETMSDQNVLDTRIDYFHPRDAMDADFTYASFFIGRPLLGMRVWDALNVVQFIRSQPNVDINHISLIGRDWAGVIAMFTAALEPDISDIAVEGAPVSYASIAMSEEYTQPVSLMLPGVLRDFDLEDVLTALAPRPLLVMNPTDARTMKMSYERAQEALKDVREGYRAAKAGNALEVRIDPFEPEVQREMASWVRAH